MSEEYSYEEVDKLLSEADGKLREIAEMTDTIYKKNAPAIRYIIKSFRELADTILLSITVFAKNEGEVEDDEAD